MNQSTVRERQEVESKHGTRYTELMRLPYFDCVRFTIVDPMHNLFLGSARHIMQNIWLSSPNFLPNDGQLKKIQDKVDNVRFPLSLGRLPNKISISFGGFTADQWKTWTLVMSIYALKGELPDEHLEVWRAFVIVCKLLCRTFVTISDVMKSTHF